MDEKILVVLATKAQRLKGAQSDHGFLCETLSLCDLVARIVS